MLAAAIGKATLADTYNLANITPNIVYELLVGGVLAATLVPVFVDLLERTRRPLDLRGLHRDDDRARGLHRGRDVALAADRPPVRARTNTAPTAPRNCTS